MTWGLVAVMREDDGSNGAKHVSHDKDAECCTDPFTAIGFNVFFFLKKKKIEIQLSRLSGSRLGDEEI